MKAKEIFSNCGNPNANCPKVLITEEGDYLVQGYKLKPLDLQQLTTPEGESVVRLPKEFFVEMLAALKPQ